MFMGMGIMMMIRASHRSKPNHPPPFLTSILPIPFYHPTQLPSSPLHTSSAPFVRFRSHLSFVCCRALSFSFIQQQSQLSPRNHYVCIASRRKCNCPTFGTLNIAYVPKETVQHLLLGQYSSIIMILDGSNALTYGLSECPNDTPGVNRSRTFCF